MNNHFKYLLKVSLILLLANGEYFGQGKGRHVSERDIRAEMGFLAGDALQGRGSGTQFERIAAEYVGSQFMQLGLEPAGETSADGKLTYVQTVNMTRGAFAGSPSIKYGDVGLLHGKEMVVMRTTTGSASGPLQKTTIGQPIASPGSAVLVTSGTAGAPESLGTVVPLLIASGAAIIMIEETPQMRANWKALGERAVTFTSEGKPSVVVVVSKDAADALSGMADSTQISFGGELAPIQTRQTWNAIGKISGTDRLLSSEVILLTSHLDHLGVNVSAPGEDKIFNGADDDASGTVAVLEIARVLARGKRPRRTVYFVCFGSEEAGGHGANYFVKNLPFPKEKLVANLEFEMIGRPDAKVKPGELWLTGYERSNLGSELARRGARLVADPHPQENFFQRSDNYTLAKQGIIAHTVSSFGLHSDYHKVSDETDTIDFAHMARSINSMVRPVQWLVNSNFAPKWHPGKKP